MTAPPFGGDRDADSPFVIESRESGTPFPQEVGGEAVTDYVRGALERLRDRERERQQDGEDAAHTNGQNGNGEVRPESGSEEPLPPSRGDAAV
jgi:hypothetical protein